MDRKNLIYYDDAGNRWLAVNMAANLTLLGFDEYDPAVDTGIQPLPVGFRMRRVNMVFVTNAGRVRRRSFPCGNLENEVYKGLATLTLTTPGIANGGGPAATINFVYRTSSTRGELRPFLTVTDPGYTTLVANDNIIEIVPNTEAGAP